MGNSQARYPGPYSIAQEVWWNWESNRNRNVKRHRICFPEIVSHRFGGNGIRLLHLLGSHRQHNARNGEWRSMQEIALGRIAALEAWRQDTLRGLVFRTGYNRRYGSLYGTTHWQSSSKWVLILDNSRKSAPVCCQGRTVPRRMISKFRRSTQAFESFVCTSDTRTLAPPTKDPPIYPYITSNTWRAARERKKGWKDRQVGSGLPIEAGLQPPICWPSIRGPEVVNVPLYLYIDKTPS